MLDLTPNALLALSRLCDVDATAAALKTEAAKSRERRDALADEMAALNDKVLAENGVVGRAMESVREARDALTETVDKIERAEAKAAKASSIKASDAATREIAELKRAKTEFDQTLTNAEFAHLEATEQLEKRQLQLKRVGEEVDEEREELLARESSIEHALENHERQKGALLETLDVPIRRRYERSSSKRVRPIARVEQNTCPECRVSLPSQMAASIRNGRTLIACTQCQTLLIHAIATGNAETIAKDH